MVLLLDGKFNKWHITFDSQEEAEKVKDMLERLINQSPMQISPCISPEQPLYCSVCNCFYSTEEALAQHVCVRTGETTVGPVHIESTTA